VLGYSLRMKTVSLVLVLIAFVFVAALQSYTTHGGRGPRFAGRGRGRQAYVQWLAVCAVIVVVVLLVRAV
jgi:hypothetical protein